jgi:LAO/AO transport system kinase
MLADRHIRPAAPAIDADKLAASIMDGDRAALARGITLVESRKAEHRALADRLLNALHARTGEAYRIGITGLPGVGKSTFIDQFGLNLADAGHRVAVLAVDPSSSRSGGSILGDKTRMGRLAHHANAYIRPSPSGRTLGGVTRATRETMLLCEAAGFDVVIVETMGVGQAETAVADITDLFLLLVAPGGGDDLQGIKRGVMELADIVVVNKADSGLLGEARKTAADYQSALMLMRPKWPELSTPVALCSAKTNFGLEELWLTISDLHRHLTDSGHLGDLRQRQAVHHLRAEFEYLVSERISRLPAFDKYREKLEDAVREGKQSPASAAAELARRAWKELA